MNLYMYESFALRSSLFAHVPVCVCFYVGDQLQDEERHRKQQLEEIRKREAEERAKQEEERRWREEERAKREAEEKVSLSLSDLIKQSKWLLDVEFGCTNETFSNYNKLTVSV